MTNSEHDHYDAFGVNTKNSFNTPPREMKNEYVIYWREEVLYRSKVIATSEEEARSHFLTLKENNAFKDDVDLEGEDFEFSIDNVECLEEDVDYD